MPKMSYFLSLRHVRHLSSTASSAAAVDTSSITVSRAQRKLRNEYEPDKALKIYSSVSDHYCSPLTSRYATELTVQRLAKSHRFDDIVTLIDSGKSDPKITQEPYFCTLVRCFGKARMFDHALRLYGEMEYLGTSRTCLSFNALLAAGNNSKRFDCVRQLFDEMPEKYGFKPDKFSYGILIKAYCGKGEPEMGLKIVREMEKKGVEVTMISYTTILDGFYKKGMNDEGEKLWNEMVRKRCKFDTAAWNVRFFHAQEGDPEVVKGLIKEMELTGLKPDIISYDYLLTCYCKNGKMDEAMKIFDEVRAAGFRPKAATFRTLIFYASKIEDYKMGYDVFKKSVRCDRIPDFGTLKVLVEGMVKKKMTEDAENLISTLKKKFPPNLLNAWKKLEIELGLVSHESLAQAQETAN